MKNRTARLGVLLAMLVAHIATTTAPAAATTVKDGVFEGSARTGPLGYPCTPVGTLDCIGAPTVSTEDPFKGFPTFGVVPAGGNTVGFIFSSTICAKASVTAKPLGGGTGKPTGPALCTITAAGVITGFCYLSTGRGVATVNNLGPPPFDKNPVSIDFLFTDVAGVIVVTGESSDTNTQLIAEVHAEPEPALPIGFGGSCTNKTANQFIVSGHFTIITKTLL